MNQVRRILNLHAGEGWTSLLLFVYLTFILAAYIVQKSVRDALFLEDYGAMNLPFLYVGVALVIGLVVAVYVRLASRAGQILLISGTLLLFMASGLFLWWTTGFKWQPLSVIYYLWANTTGIILTAQVWTLATSILTSEQAGRMVPFICSGGILGSTLGGLIAAAGARRIGTDNLILIPVFLLGGCLVILHMLARNHQRSSHDARLPSETVASKDTSVGEVLRVTFRTRYLRLIASLLSLSAIVTLIVDFQFKVATQEIFQNRDALTAFFGSFYAYVGFGSFFVQFFAGSRLFEKYGLRMALLFLPMALLGGTAALLVYPTLIWTGIFLKGSDGVIRGSIDKSTMEMLYVPVPQSVKVQVKAVIDMLIQRFSDGIGGVLLLLMTHVLGFGLYGVGVLNAVLLVLWIGIARETRHEYQAALDETLPLPGDEIRAPLQEKAA